MSTYQTNGDKILRAVIADEQLINFYSYNPDDYNSLSDALDSDNAVIQAIAQIINSLPEKQRTIIQLRDIEGKSYKEIANVLSISESDVKVTLFRARNEMKEKILQKKSFFL